MNTQASLIECKKLELRILQEQARKKTAECGEAVREANRLEKEIKELQRKEMENK